MADPNIEGSETGRPNRLINEKSPYLLQHAYNPVVWHPWGDEAFGRAREEGKPRLDHLYMAVCQLLTGGGGWPLTILMTPDKKPFFAGTYFPKESRYGRIGLMALIARVQELWDSRPHELLDSAEKITSALQGLEEEGRSMRLDNTILDRAYKDLAHAFDEEHGGFGPAPKFPSPHNLSFLLRYWKHRGESGALAKGEQVLSGGYYAERAARAVDFILSRMYQKGGLLHRYRDGEAKISAHLDDYAFFVWGLIELYEATFDPGYLETALTLTREQIPLFWDEKRGGFFFSPKDADDLIARR